MEHKRNFSSIALIMLALAFAVGCSTASGEYKLLTGEQWPDLLPVDIPADWKSDVDFNELTSEDGLYITGKLLAEARRPYRSAYLTDGLNRHISVHLEIVGGIPRPPVTGPRYAINPGSLPYSPPGAGDIYVIYLKADSSVIGLRTMKDPLVWRSCGTFGGGSPGVKPVVNGRTRILAPYDPDIAAVGLKWSSGPAYVFTLDPSP